jgi:hypothetical protein
MEDRMFVVLESMIVVPSVNASDAAVSETFSGAAADKNYTPIIQFH